MLSSFYRELTQAAFSGRATEIAAQALNSSKGSLDEVESDLDLEPRQSIWFEEDYEAILQVVQSGVGGAEKLIGIEMIQKAIDVLSERLDFVVPNSIPIPAPLSDTLKNSIGRRQEFIKNDYDKAVVDKILMVLVNSEGLAQKRFGLPATEESADEDKDAERANRGRRSVEGAGTCAKDVTFSDIATDISIRRRRRKRKMRRRKWSTIPPKRRNTPGTAKTPLRG